jgi:hypothetical protein
LAAPAASQRYEHARPGDLLRLDTKKRGRIAGLGHRGSPAASHVNRHKGIGGDCLHVAVDDHSSRAAAHASLSG